MIAALAMSKGAINHHIALGTDAKSVTKPLGTVIVSVLLAFGWFYPLLPSVIAYNGDAAMGSN
mgnify:CR=1 FL=1